MHPVCCQGVEKALHNLDMALEQWTATIFNMQDSIISSVIVLSSKKFLGGAYDREEQSELFKLGYIHVFSRTGA